MPRDKESRQWKLTELYVLLLRETTSLLAQADPVGLTTGGAPEDEYDMEAGQIVRRVIHEAKSPQDVERIASEVFEEMFGVAYSSRFTDLAQAVWRRFEEDARDSGLADLLPRD